MQTGGRILFNYTEVDTSFIYTRAYYKLANMLLLVKKVGCVNFSSPLFRFQVVGQIDAGTIKQLAISLGKDWRIRKLQC